MSRLRQQYGFTLLELQISLLIFTSLLLFSGSTLFMSTKIIKRVDTVSQQDQSIRISLKFVEERIRTIEAITSDQNFKQLAFSGNEDELLYIGQLPDSLQSAQTAIQRIYLQAGTDSSELLYSFDEDNDNTFIETLHRPELLSSYTIMEDIESIEFLYYGKKSDLAAEEWHSDWEDLPYLPKKIKMSLTYRNSNIAIDRIVFLPTHLSLSDERRT